MRFFSGTNRRYFQLKARSDISALATWQKIKHILERKMTEHIEHQINVANTRGMKWKHLSCVHCKSKPCRQPRGTVDINQRPCNISVGTFAHDKAGRGKTEPAACDSVFTTQLRQKKSHPPLLNSSHALWWKEKKKWGML